MIDFSAYKIENVKDFTKYIYTFYSTMVANSVKLVYEGEITHQITKALTALAESQMITDDESTVTQKKVFHVIVECLQNITKHADVISDMDENGRTGKGIFVVIKDSENYNITSGNVIAKNKIPFLSTLLENINNTDKEGLKELYKTQIKEGRISEKGGAGLGLIDMARKSGNKLDFNIMEINNDFSFFILTAKVSREL
jgi:hypothetical protein